MLIHVTNITRDILGYNNNTIVFFSIQGTSKHSSTPVWAKLYGKKSDSETQKSAETYDIGQSFFI